MRRHLAFTFVLVLLAASPLGCRRSSGADAGDTGNGSGMDSGTGGDDTGTGGGDDTGTGGGDDTGTGGGDDTGTGGGSDTGTGGGTHDANADGGGTLALGTPCSTDSSCASHRCEIVEAGHGAICVTPCTFGTDCTDTTTYCAAIPGHTDGVCAPRTSGSASLCQTCSTDAECGALGAVCAVGPHDTAMACHTDCSLDPVHGCPSGYSCSFVTVGGASRQICAPTATDCAGALSCTGGTPCASGQMCCSGTCTVVNTVTDCGGCGIHCSGSDGCCGMSCIPLTTLANCGMCGNTCPNAGTTGDSSCSMGMCQLTCRGEHWDVNGNNADGCEDTDTTPPGHTAVSAASRGSFNSCDATSTDSFSGRILSDARLHLPAVPGLVLAVGSTPDFWTVTATGAPPNDTGVACTNDLRATITTTGGSSSGTCYRLTITGGTSTYTASVSGSGSATITQAAPAYAAGATLTFEIEKTCSSATHEAVSYTVSYHL